MLSYTPVKIKLASLIYFSVVPLSVTLTPTFIYFLFPRTSASGLYVFSFAPSIAEYSPSLDSDAYH